MKVKMKAFTLIELLIVVAIIAILAAIAVPNFLEAQMRAKVGRVKADMRTAALALESYAIDNNKYPHLVLYKLHGYQYNRGGISACTNLSTPVAYLSSSSIPDPFASQHSIDTAGDIVIGGLPRPGYSFSLHFNNIRGHSEGWGEAPYTEAADHWAPFLLLSLGPNYRKGPDPYTGAEWPIGAYDNAAYGRQHAKFTEWNYDPSNGTLSGGDILYWGGGGN